MVGMIRVKEMEPKTPHIIPRATGPTLPIITLFNTFWIKIKTFLKDKIINSPTKKEYFVPETPEPNSQD